MTEQRHAMFADAKALEAQLGVAVGFLEGLLNDGDDWSFIIKVHALAEAALTDLLTATVAREELRDLFASPTMGDTKRGKLAVASRLRVLDAGGVIFLRALGRMRNQFVHDVHNVGRRLEDYANALKPEERSQFWRELMRGYTREPVIIDGDRSMPVEQFVAAHPRFTVWISMVSTVSLIYKFKTADPAIRERASEVLSTMKPLRNRHSGRPTSSS